MRVRNIRTHKQQEIIDCEAPFLAVPGGLGAGKTRCLCDFVVDQMVRFPGSTGAAAANSYPQLLASIYEELDYWLTSRHIRFKPPTSQHRVLYLSNGSRLYFISFEVPAGRMKGPEYDFIGIDEGDIVEREHYQLLSDRARGQTGSCKVRSFANAVSQSHWLAQDYWLNPLPGHQLIRVETYDNRRFLRPGTIERYEARYPVGTRLHDKWLLGLPGIPNDGAVFPEFDPKRDIVDAENCPAFRETVMAMFMGDKRPTAALVCGITEDGNLVVTAEYYESQRPMAAHAEAISAMGRGAILADREHELFSQYRRQGLRLAPGDTRLTIGNMNVRKLLVEGRVRIVRRRDGRLAAPNLAREFEEYAYNASQEPEDKRNEAIACLRLATQYMHRDRQRTLARALESAFAAHPMAV